MRNYTSTKRFSFLIVAALVAASSLTLAQSEIMDSASIFEGSFSPKSVIQEKIFADGMAKHYGLPREKIIGRTTKLRPKNAVTYSLAVKSLCRAEKWVKKISWKNCLAYAKKLGLTKKPIPSKITEKKKLLFKDLVLLLERAWALKNKRSVAEAPKEAEIINSPPAPSEIPALKTSALNFTPHTETTEAADFFADVTLAAPLPTLFYKDEVYYVEGDLVAKTSDEIFVFLCKENDECEDSLNFIEKTTNGGKHFRIPVFFRETGNYQLGVILGRSGQSQVAEISVVPEFLNTPGGETPLELTASYSSGKARFRWNGAGAWTRLTFYQGDVRQDYLFRQPILDFSPPSEDFKNFKKGPAFWFVTRDSARSAIQTLFLTIQDFRKIKETMIEVKELTEKMESPGKFIFEGEAKSSVAKRAAVQLPTGLVEEFNIADEDIPSGGNVRIERDFTTEGAYIFEVNDPTGSAIVNVPVYVGATFPLLPDFFALNKPKLSTAPVGNLGDARKELLKLINRDRADHGISPVALDDELNTVAQGHSNNMATNNFFGHTDPEGRSPDDRRKEAGYPSGIRENLAKATDLSDAEQGLMRSPVHRAAILDKEMTRVGLGLAKNKEGYLFVTQNFSADPVRPGDLPPIADQLFQDAQKRREELGFGALTNDDVLRQIAADWSLLMNNENFFGIKNSEGRSIVDEARALGIQTRIQVQMVKVSEKSQLKEELLKQTALAEPDHRNIGIGLAVSDEGVLYMTVVYTP